VHTWLLILDITGTMTDSKKILKYVLKTVTGGAIENKPLRFVKPEKNRLKIQQKN